MTRFPLLAGSILALFVGFSVSIAQEAAPNKAVHSKGVADSPLMQQEQQEKEAEAGAGGKESYESEESASPPPPPEPDAYDQEKSNYYLMEAREKSKLATDIMQELPAHYREFVQRYERIKWYKDMDALEAVIHPASAACENEENKAFFDYMRYFYLSESLPKGYRLQIMPVDRQKRWALKERLSLPLPPTHILYMEFRVENHVEGIQRFLREETEPETRLYELVKCPDAETLEQFKAGEGLMNFHGEEITEDGKKID